MKMQEIGISTTISSDTGLIFQHDLDFPTKTISTPIKTVPIDCFTAQHYVQDSVRDIVEVHKRIDTSDLEAYRTGTLTRRLVELQEDLKYSDGDDIVVTILEYTDAQEIDAGDMRTILKIQDELADVLTMPLIPSLTNGLSTILDNDIQFNRSPWPAYSNSVEHFIENVVDFDKPAMGILPPIAEGRRIELLRNYEATGIQMYGVDFAGLKATTPENFQQFGNLMQDIAKRGVQRERILYGLNFKRYHPTQNTDSYPSEAVALAVCGIDIAGETHIHRQGGGGDVEITDTKIFNPNTFGVDAVELDSLEANWDYPSTIEPSEFIGVSDGKRRELRKLVNSELLSIGFRKLRAAVRDGTERSFLERKTGFQGQVKSRAKEMNGLYLDATGANVA